MHTVKAKKGVMRTEAQFLTEREGWWTVNATGNWKDGLGNWQATARTERKRRAKYSRQNGKTRRTGKKFRADVANKPGDKRDGTQT